MKDYKEVRLPKGLVGYESENGHNIWWYPAKNSPIEMPINVNARHLYLWRGQGDMIVFSVPMCAFKPTEIFNDKGRKQYVAIWFYTEDIDEIVNSQTV